MTTMTASVIWGEDDGQYYNLAEQRGIVRERIVAHYGRVRLQFSAHGCDRYSVQAFCRGKLVADIDL